MAIITISGNLTETPIANPHGYYNFRIVEPTPPNHPRIKGEQAWDVEATPAFDKILPKLFPGSAVVALCEQRIDHFLTKSGYETTRPKNHLIRINFAPLDQRKKHTAEQFEQLRQTATAPTPYQQPTPHQQAKQNGYMPTQEADSDIPF